MWKRIKFLLIVVAVLTGAIAFTNASDGAHQDCPYSKATRGNINLVINLIEAGSAMT